MIDPTIEDLMEAIDSGLDRNWEWHTFGPDALASLAELGRRAISAERDLFEARDLLADAYEGDSDLRTNRWFERVEDIGGWPRPGKP